LENCLGEDGGDADVYVSLFTLLSEGWYYADA
jgi:hypothetical protein